MIKIGSKPETDTLEAKNHPEEDEDFTAESSSPEESSLAKPDSEDTLVIALAKDVSERVFTLQVVRSDELKRTRWTKS